MLSRFSLMVQAAVLDGQFLDLLSPFDDSGVPAEVGVSRGDVVQALMVAVIVVMIDELADLVLKVTRQIIVLQQDAVFERLMPSLDLALGLRMVWRPSNMIHFLVFQPFRQVTGDVG